MHIAANKKNNPITVWHQIRQEPNIHLHAVLFLLDWRFFSEWIQLILECCARQMAHVCCSRGNKIRNVHINREFGFPAHTLAQAKMFFRIMTQAKSLRQSTQDATSLPQPTNQPRSPRTKGENIVTPSQNIFINYFIVTSSQSILHSEEFENWSCAKIN